MKIIYFYICIIYNKIFTFIENSFLFNRKIIKQSDLSTMGYELHNLGEINLVLNPEKKNKT